MFDTVIDTAPDATMEEADAVMEIAREEEAKISQRLLRMVSRNLGQNVNELPFIRKPATPRTRPESGVIEDAEQKKQTS